MLLLGIKGKEVLECLEWKNIKMPGDIPTYYCRRIKKEVYADTMEDSGRIFIVCKYYDSSSCILNPTKTRNCLVKLTVQREEKSKLIS